MASALCVLSAKETSVNLSSPGLVTIKPPSFACHTPGAHHAKTAVISITSASPPIKMDQSNGVMVEILRSLKKVGKSSWQSAVGWSVHYSS